MCVTESLLCTAETHCKQIIHQLKICNRKNNDQKTKTSCSVKDTGKNIKTQAVDWRKIFVHLGTII